MESAETMVTPTETFISQAMSNDQFLIVSSPEMEFQPMMNETYPIQQVWDMNFQGVQTQSPMQQCMQMQQMQMNSPDMQMQSPDMQMQQMQDMQMQQMQMQQMQMQSPGMQMQSP